MAASVHIGLEPKRVQAYATLYIKAGIWNGILQLPISICIKDTLK